MADAIVLLYAAHRVIASSSSRKVQFQKTEDKRTALVAEM